jgi:hypothetical protein
MLAGVVQELHIERAASRGHGRQHLPRQGCARAARHAVGLRRHRAGARRLPARGRHPGSTASSRQRANRRRSSGWSSRATRSWCRWSRTRSAPRARACPPRSERSPGGMLVYLPQDPHIGVSQRIEDEAERAHPARECCAASLAGGGNGGGYIMRTSAEDASEEELAADIAYLRKRWAQIREAAAQVPAPSAAVRGAVAGAARAARRGLTEETHLDPGRLARELRSPCRRSAAGVHTASVLEQAGALRGERPLFDLYHVDDEIERALGRRVDLKSGGYLIIDQTEAMTTIDVNTGGFVGARNFDDTVFQDQPRGGAGDRAPAAPAQPRRHHRRRLHRHGARRAPRGGARRAAQALARDGQDE